MNNEKQKTILLVEDDRIIALAETAQLKKLGYNSIPAYSGVEAVEVFTNNCTGIDLILMDINLGKGIDGTEAAQRILALQHIPIVFLTSHAEKEYVEKVKQITRYGYVLKNCGDFVLKSSIEMAFELFDTNEKLTKNEERLTFALNGANDGLWDVQMDTGAVYLSKRGCEILGYAEDELPDIVRVWPELVHPEDLPATQQALNAYLEGRKDIFRIEQRLKTKSGEYKWVLARGKAVSFNAAGNPLRMVGTHTDISERKKVEQKLHEQTIMFQAFLENSPIYVFFKDSDIRAVYLSRNYEKMLGMPLEKIIGKDMNELFPSDLANSMIEDDKKILREGKLVEVEEFFNGRYFSTIKFPIPLENGSSYLAGFTMDITDRKQNEQRINALLGEKELILKEVHHRVKNHMCSIESMLSIQSDLLTNPDALRVIKDTISRIHSMGLLYEKLFQSDNLVDTSIADYLSLLIDEIAQIFPNAKKVKIEKNIEVFSVNGKVLFSVGIIVNEIMTNAMKYAFAGRDSGLIQVSIAKNENHVTLIIQDDGIGISESKAATDTKGFGLSLIDLLATNLKGSFETETANGTKCILKFDM